MSPRDIVVGTGGALVGLLTGAVLFICVEAKAWVDTDGNWHDRPSPSVTERNTQSNSADALNEQRSQRYEQRRNPC